MMAGNPSWRIMGSSPKTQQEYQQPTPSFFSLAHPDQLVLGAHVGSPSPNYPFSDSYHSRSQLLLGGLTSEEDTFGGVVGHFQPFKKLENWEAQILNPSRAHYYVKQEQDQASQNISDDQDLIHHQFHNVISSPRSCVTTSFSSNNYNNSNDKNNSILDFSHKEPDHGSGSRSHHVAPDHSSECNSTATGGVCKKARVQPPLKVRKEKLGDRVTALHQLVSPFGKTDTASVLLEAIGYIRFLQRQIEALSTPYLSNSSGNMRAQHPVSQGEQNGAFGPEIEMQMDSEEEFKDLKGGGLCLVPVSYSQQVGSDNGADYWAPAFGSGGGI